MKKLICTGIALLLILSGCTAPSPTPLPTESFTQGIYEFTFSVEQLSGEATDQWEFIYTYNGKTIVCGHWHCSFGHAHYEHDGGEFEDNPNFNPYYANGIIALDACTPLSRKVNCIVIED